ncbi:multidrug effflux MFS transporter [Aurantiacibacter sp. MUD11]|uniref:multidrug effflux MFS transporter n=1 Tax=Aurantiacibacter sp. MUD11 TaxID=3003265 RepID=UPI0022AA06A5|nr:multidrug effflux MFS transporter [Aurantiacibacter sp. MUD11]WAT17634.1 multidrug effflux MFS transporter [Aurantiacibacter sp. MUD11]
MTKGSPLDSLPLGRRELIVLLALLMSLNALGIDAMLPALDEMAADLGVADGNDRQLVIAVYTIMMGVGCLVPGSYADRYGRRPIIFLALIAFSVLSLVTAMLTDFESMIVIRGVTGLLGAGLMVVPMAIVRDLYEGDHMARLMSTIAAVFISVPVFAPSLGQAILLVGSWRLIFVALSLVGVATAAWVYFRLPETLAPANRQEINLPVIARNMGVSLMNRQSIGYVLGSMLVMGGVFGYVNSGQQLYQDAFGVSDAAFPVLFGATAAMMSFTNLINSRIVMRFGARRVSHFGVIMFITVSAVQVWSSYVHPGNISWFLPLMSINLALLGFLGANFGSIAMQPFAHIAGSASSVQTFFRMFGAAMVGMIIGQSYDGTAIPFAWALLICSSTALMLVLFSERGRLFRRLNVMPPKERVVP